MTTENHTNAQNHQQPVFAIQTIYSKDISFETPNSPQVFRENWQPNVNLDLNITSNLLEPDIYEVVLIITVTAKNGDKVAFITEIHQAGVFTLQNFNQQQLPHMLGSYCPNVLFPYAREVASDLITRGGFPRLYLAPINFDALYEQKIKEQQAEAAGQAGTAAN